MQTWSAGTLYKAASATILRDPIIVGAVLVALCLRLINLDSAPLWLDETITANWIQLSWLGMLRSVLGDNHLPLYPLLMKMWSVVAGSSPYALRLPSVLFSCGTLPLIAGIAWILIGIDQARWAAWIAALSP